MVGCGGDKAEKQAPPGTEKTSVWRATPEKVVEGIMHAYEARDDSLYASLLADDYRYFFEPPDAKPEDVLGWGKEEDLVSTGNLFRTEDVKDLSFKLEAGPAESVSRPAARKGDPAPGEAWAKIPVAGGQLKVTVSLKEPMVVDLNRQEILLRKDPGGWRIVEWHDFPAP